VLPVEPAAIWIAKPGSPELVTLSDCCAVVGRVKLDAGD
jgi:hypothetical protein